MKKPDNEDIIIQIEETLHLFLWPNNITTFSLFPVMFYLPCADHVLLFVDDVVTSWPQTKISDWSDIKCIVTLAVQNRTCSIPKVCIKQLLKVAWYRVITLFTLYFLVYDTSIMILALPCNKGFTYKVWCPVSSTHGLYQMIHRPTRVTSKSVTLIDHIYTRRPQALVSFKKYMPPPLLK